MRSRASPGRSRGDTIVDGAARSRRALDDAEREALAAVVGPEGVLLATSASLGRVGAAAPLLQAITLARCLAEGVLPPISGLVAAGRGPLRPLTKPTPTRARSAIAISTGAPGGVGVVRVELA